MGWILLHHQLKAPVRKYFGYVKDLRGYQKGGNWKKLCVSCVESRSLTQEERPISRTTYNVRSHVYSDDLRSNVEDQTQPMMNVFCHTVEKLSSSSVRVQQLTSAVVDFVVRDLRPVNVVENVGFLHLTEVAEPRYVVPCCRTVNSYINKTYLAVKARCSSSNNLTIWNDDRYVNFEVHLNSCPLHFTIVCDEASQPAELPFSGNHTALTLL